MLTVVAKLFGLVRPDVAVFGEKDYQQLALIRRMVADLCLGVDVVGADTVREPDGLALSSRNRYLDADDRRGRAVALSRALFAARDAAALRRWRPLDAARARARELGGVDVDYLELTRTPTSAPPRRRRGPAAGRRPRRQHPADRQRRPHPDLDGRRRLMLRTMMKSKIHRATVTQADLHYVGSVTVDEDLLDAADLLPGELVHIVDVTNGARLETYTIAGERGSGVIGINGAAARLVHPGDLVILIAYGQMETAEARDVRAAAWSSSTPTTGSSAPAPTRPRRCPAADLVRGDLHSHAPSDRAVTPIASCRCAPLRLASAPGEPGWTVTPTSSSSAPASPG